ncbi:kinesin-like protein KIN-12D isoform X2 [Rhodamnia argentea]|uniref:Kinesin-like protein KIN-12D isoform X2 n=1 Tax=Rhodamnia argentea TaxID=178133 RepID=A0A8B8NLR3_9MYRT|nr:kinesin-like protein KIN-12D isoform X2 [Rhodamnia argentea]
MLRDLKFLRRNSGKHEEVENVPSQPNSSSAIQPWDPSRAPLNAIQEPPPNPRPEAEVSTKSRVDRTPSKPKVRNADPSLPFRTPEKHNLAVSSKNRFGWAKNESGPVTADTNDDSRGDEKNFSTQFSRGIGVGNFATPRMTRTVGRANSNYSESASTQSTPTKSVNKPPSVGFRSKLDSNGGGRWGNFAALYKGIPSSIGPATVVNTVEVPHFDLKEDPSFWMEHNVQVLIRVRPLNNMERSTYGYNRCLKQESSQSITWVGQPETRFTFDHVACETVDQEMLFRMVGLPMVENCLSGYNSCMFAYGQTGSGKTYTMLGEIEDLELKPSTHRGMTPRIFEFLFARIQAEEESRRDEQLTYNCKCSFLEIYNEQITDLLDPSSTNLLLREDVKKGVHVENLSEFEVQTVTDILKLLTEGSSNRKVAATNMNRESSRSHSVFTCVIESRWEKDSATNLRFARLNLVDLAGSERQKTSGAEGDRLKEAANINKSLSTLGHVIMVLVDVANGKPRHVPYRDSRLTFLLQDSLGGNSKTIIIANISPSISSSAETLNTLKFAQRAKLIQNNAVVNEDSTGDVIALQNQIRLLKEELSALKCHNISRSLSFGTTSIGGAGDKTDGVDDYLHFDPSGVVRMSNKQLKSLETTLAGALRREQMAEITIRKLEAEIEQLNRLVRQREEDTRCTKMMLRFREDKIQRLESLRVGSITAEVYLHEENKTLSEEIQLLQAKVGRNPEVTRFALENIRLLDQLRRFQEFYEEGERELLLAEVSKLRDQLLQFMDGNSEQPNHFSSGIQSQEAMQAGKENATLQLELRNTSEELEDCRRNLTSCLEENAKLSREMHHLSCRLDDLNSQDNNGDGNSKKGLGDKHSQEPQGKHTILGNKHAEEIMDLQLELDILKIIIKEERTSQGELEERIICLNEDLELATEKLLSTTKRCEDVTSELKEAKSVIEALESQQILSLNEIEDLQSSNRNSMKLLSLKEIEIVALKKQLSSKRFRDQESSKGAESEDSPMQARLKKMHDSLEKAKQLNMWYQNNHAFQVSNEEEMDKVCKQAEAETAEVIVCMQEELTILQQQVLDSQVREMETKQNTVMLQTELKDLQEKLYLVTENNKQLIGLLENRDRELQTLSEEWKLLTCEIEEVLADGNESLAVASDELGHISNSFPQKRIWIAEHFSQMIRTVSEKDLMIEELSRYLEDANKKRNDLDCMLKSLRGAALAITEAHQQECTEKEREIVLLISQLEATAHKQSKLMERVKFAENNIKNASTTATAAFVVVNRLSEVNHNNITKLEQKDILLRESADMNMKKDIFLSEQAATLEESKKEIDSLRKDLAHVENACTVLRKERLEEQQHLFVMERKLERREESDIMKARDKLDELKTGVSMLRSCMSDYLEHDESPQGTDEQLLYASSSKKVDRLINSETSTEKSLNLRAIEGPSGDDTSCSFLVGNTVPPYSYDRDITISLLRKEIECALESLKQVQTEMAQLYREKEERLLSEERGRDRAKWLTNQLLSLEGVMRNFEEQSQLKIEALNLKMHTVGQTVKNASRDWCKTKELLECEVGDAEIVAAEKSAEASLILAKFEEAQDTLKEADTIINKLVMANEAMKLDISKLEKNLGSLMEERDMLLNEVQSLQSISSQKHQQIDSLEEHISLHMAETRDLLAGLHEIAGEFQSTFEEQFSLLATDFNSMKFQVSNSTKLVKSWLEEIWSEIIVRDCAVSSLHLCHIGIMLETVTGLNAENGLLQHGLHKKNSLLTDLREHNLRSKKELEVFRILKGKLLADIKNSFDRILRKEEEAGDMSNKLTGFEKKLLDLQYQEELMLERSNHMGSQLAILTKELDWTSSNAINSLLDQVKLMRAEEEASHSELELLRLDLCSKDFELLILRKEIEEMALQKANLNSKNINCSAALHNLTREIIISKVEGELKKQVLLDNEIQMSLLKKEIGEADSKRLDMSTKLSESNSRILQRDGVIRALEQDLQLLKEVDHANGMLQAELSESKTTEMRLLSQIESLEADQEKIAVNLRTKETALDCSSNQMSSLHQQNQKLKGDVCSLKSSLEVFQSELDQKNQELSRMVGLRKAHEVLNMEMSKLKNEKKLVLQDLAEKKSECESSLSSIDTFNKENIRLNDQIILLETSIVSLKTDLDEKDAQLHEIEHSRSLLLEDLSRKGEKLQLYTHSLSNLENENKLLRKTLQVTEKGIELLIASGLESKICIELVNTIDISNGRLYDVIASGAFRSMGNMLEQIHEDAEQISMFIEQVECFDQHVKELMADNLTLRTELLRKDDVLKGLLFDLSLLQESASNTIDQKDEIEEMAANLESLENELAGKTDELDEAIARSQKLEAELQEKVHTISVLELDITKEYEKLDSLSKENMDLKACLQRALAEKGSAEEDLVERSKEIESLEMELSAMGNAIDQMNDSMEYLKSNLDELTLERDQFQAEVLTLQEKLEKAWATAHNNEAVAIEAQRRAEERETYALDKEEEVKLLERSVEELEHTINVLEDKVDIVKGEAERQRLLREELELELHSIKSQMQNVQNADADIKRHLDEKKADLEKSLKQVQMLEREIAEKDAETVQLKAHITEINLHAEAQASEYKQKFKALEAMADQVKPEGSFTQNTNQLSYKSEKNTSKPRGSGSPFKCIGLGLAQQVKSENVEELTAVRLQIAELESLVISKQKEIFSLNAKLAAAESMTHDVIRDLLGVKLDMNSYVSLLDNQQVEKVIEKPHLQKSESQSEVMKLKKQLNEFVDERKGWLEEIERRQAELVAAQITLEKHHQQEQLLSTENELLKIENVKCKKKMTELQDEISKLSGQQNLQQRIHHHAKIKEENNILKIQVEELATKLRRAEVILSRFKEEQAHRRASVGKSPYLNFDEEQRWSDKVKEAEEEKLQLAQKLLGLCTRILTVAGFSKPRSEICPSIAEEALEQLKDRITSMESELHDLKNKDRIDNERARLSELMPQQEQHSPINRRPDETYRTSRRVSRTPFLSTLDR